VSGSFIRAGRAATILGLASGALWTATASGETHELCFYVEQPCTILGVPVGAGHAFLELHDLKGTFGGARYVRGFYPAAADIFGGAGKVKDDAARPWHYKICYSITWAQWDAVAAGVNAKQNAPPAYNLLTFNCTDWITQKAGLAGVALPVKVNNVNVADPNAFWQSLDALGNGGTFGGGTVTANPNPPLAGPVCDPGSPLCSDFGFDQVQAWGHLDAASLSAAMQLPLVELKISSVTAGLNDPWHVGVTGTSPGVALISMSWGDGSPVESQLPAFAHAYAAPGTYEASLLVVGRGSVSHYVLAVNVFGGAQTVDMDILVQPFPPSQVPNAGCPDGGPIPPQPGTCPFDCGDGDGTVGVVDFLALLAGWGAPGPCDFDGGDVGVTDFLALLGHWGACP
jgi:hypothetical protein